MLFIHRAQAVVLQLSKYPRVRLWHFPTPLEFMPNLTRLLGGPNIYIKRDDCTGLATGGNKTRKVEVLVAHAIEQGADTLITQGAVQSNHVSQTIAAGARLGLQRSEERRGGNECVSNWQYWWSPLS